MSFDILSPLVVSEPFVFANSPLNPAEGSVIYVASKYLTPGVQSRFADPRVNSKFAQPGVQSDFTPRDD